MILKDSNNKDVLYRSNAKSLLQVIHTCAQMVAHTCASDTAHMCEWQHTCVQVARTHSYVVILMYNIAMYLPI